MNSVQITLRDFFGYGGLSQGQVSGIESSRSMPALKAALANKAKDITWPAARDEIANQVEGLLDGSVLDVLAFGWNKYQALRKYADRKKYSPDETFLVSLAKHTVRSSYNPYVEVLVDDKSVGRVDFSINVELTLEGVILCIRDGRIKKIRAASCKGKGTVKCEDFVLLEREPAAFTLPASIDLGEGIAIAN